MKNNKGFTLIEMVVVLAVVAILAAILTPTIAKNINDAKLTRAVNETQVIGAALAAFYKDVGRWPTSDGAAAALPDVADLLYGGVGNDPTATTGGVLWDKDTAAAAEIMENHLIGNDPGGGGANDYPVWTNATKIGWNGPYLGEIKADPWGVYYMCNIIYAHDDPNASGAWVISGGPNRDPETIFAILVTTTALTGDDLGVRID
ncbi:MAG: prepilin-type N-terminal cleavage/methylation domain-containing protein [bacterium]|nr:prepilin-type N-terminal cleavage/methylation domain-containing protein [bacterium]